MGNGWEKLFLLLALQLGDCMRECCVLCIFTSSPIYFVREEAGLPNTLRAVRRTRAKSKDGLFSHKRHDWRLLGVVYCIQGTGHSWLAGIRRDYQIICRKYSCSTLLAALIIDRRGFRGLVAHKKTPQVRAHIAAIFSMADSGAEKRWRQHVPLFSSGRLRQSTLA